MAMSVPGEVGMGASTLGGIAFGGVFLAPVVGALGGAVIGASYGIAGAILGTIVGLVLVGSVWWALVMLAGKSGMDLSIL